MVSTLPWLHSVVHAGILFMMVDCKLLQVPVVVMRQPLSCLDAPAVWCQSQHGGVCFSRVEAERALRNRA
jgi:hypothetical protein